MIITGIIIFLIYAVLMAWGIALAIAIIWFTASLFDHNGPLDLFLTQHETAIFIVCGILGIICTIVHFRDFFANLGSPSNITHNKKSDKTYTHKSTNKISNNYDLTFVDAQGNYRKYGDSFIDTKGNYCNWGDGFYDYDGNYIHWGGTFKDSSGAYRYWGEGFYDGAGRWVNIKR